MTERQLTLYKPSLSGDQQLFVRRIDGREAISELFAYEVILYSKSDNVDFGKVLGQDMCIGLTQPKGDKERFFNGYVASFASIGTEGGFHLYRAELRPSHWRTTRAVNCRGFQAEAVPDIISSVLNAHGLGGMVTSLSRNYLPWEYCVQYRESDFAFVSRLLEREGIHYFFKHEKDKHSLHLADTNLHETVPGYAEVAYKLDGTHHPGDETVWGLTLSKQVLTDRATLSDYDFTKPKEPLMRTSGSEVKREHDDARDYEGYDYLETVVQQTGYTADLTEEYARIRTEEIHSHYAVVTAETNARGIQPGSCFKLKEHRTSARNIEYLVLSTHIHAEIDERGSTTGSHGELLYRCTFEAIDAKTPFRPARITPKPRIPGPQSATVVGPASAKDHHTDQWGRVLVKFHWYRPPESTEKDISFWVRVAQNSAGSGWGSMFVPNLGQEVIVSFYEGDPDRPVVTGRVYNGSNKPPLELPANAYKSIIRDFGGNEIIFDSTPGNEHMMFHSPKHGSVYMLGKSDKSRTESDKVEASNNKKSYALGNNDSYTRGNSFKLTKGNSTSIDLGTKVSLSSGLEFKATASSSFELKLGVFMSYAMSSTITWGYATELKKTKGGYTRMSSKDVILDSGTKAIVSGGPKDRTMLLSTDAGISLSYDESAPSRKGAIDGADAQMKAMSGLFAAKAALLSGLGVWEYNQAKFTEKRDAHGKQSPDVEAELGEFNRFTEGDIMVGAGALNSMVGGLLPSLITLPTPDHPQPSAKVILSKDEVLIYAGIDQESSALFKNGSGLAFTAKKGDIKLSADAGGVTVKAKGEILLKSDAAVNVDAILKHKNMVVMK